MENNLKDTICQDNIVEEVREKLLKRSKIGRAHV